jgi:hypothetical protein
MIIIIKLARPGRFFIRTSMLMTTLYIGGAANSLRVGSSFFGARPMVLAA